MWEKYHDYAFKRSLWSLKAMNDLVSNKDVKWTKLQRQSTLKA